MAVRRCLVLISQVISLQIVLNMAFVVKLVRVALVALNCHFLVQHLPKKIDQLNKLKIKKCEFFYSLR